MLIRHITTIVTEVFKSLHHLNPNVLKEKMFNIKQLTYALRDSNSVYQPNYEQVTYGNNICGIHLWNLLLNEINEKQILYRLQNYL